MKMVRSLLLGTAAGLVAIAGAQAADLPVKAKPVQYVKICSLYGAGFYYIPGTDTCLKLGGYVRVQFETGAADGGIPDIAGGNQGNQTRFSYGYGYTARGHFTADARSQTEYGTLRSYFTLAMQNRDIRNPSNAAVATAVTSGPASIGDVANMERAFIQFAGFTVGTIESMYDFLSWAPYNYSNARSGSNTGAGGIVAFAYTAQFGNGLSATLSVEDNVYRRTSLINTGNAAFAATTFATAPTNNYGGPGNPDLVGNLRVDQTWGSAQIMGAAHEIRAGYNSAAGAGNGFPGSEWGLAAGVGLRINVPQAGAGSHFAIQANWSKGATGYVSQAGNMFRQNAAVDAGYGYVSDGVYTGASTTTGIEKTAAWGVLGVYEQVWSPKLRTSIYGGYTEINYNDTANTALCSMIATAVIPTAQCDNDWSFWQAGSRTAWYPVQNLEIGLDVLYTKLNTASAGTGGTGISGVAINQLTTTRADQDVWTVMMRWQRSFWP